MQTSQATQLPTAIPDGLTDTPAYRTGSGCFVCGQDGCTHQTIGLPATLNADGSVSAAADYALEGAKWGSGGTGTGGGTVTWSYASHNYTDREEFGSTLSFMPSGYESMVQQAFAAWSQVANITFVQVTDAADVDIRLGGGTIDGRNGTLATTYYQYQGSSMTQADIVFDSSEPWTASASSGTYAYSVIVHEIGHAIGLGHTGVQPAIMYPYTANLAALQPDDIAGAVALYGAAAGTTTPITTTPTTTTGFTPTEASDSYVGTSGADTVSLLGGDDRAEGMGGNDQLYGNQGDDMLLGGDGADSLFGGQGTDTVSGGAGNDQLYGNMANDGMWGGSGQDTLFGGQGDDVIQGGDGDDFLFGNLGNDTLYGDNAATSTGAGADVIDGGDGLDTAVFLFTRSQYTLAHAADGAIVVNSADRLYRVEYLRFSDQTIEAAWI